MAKPLLVVCDRLPADPGWQLPAYEVSRLGLAGRIPDQNTLRDFHTVVVIGRVGSGASALQFGGALRLAVESGVRALLLYPITVDGADRQLFDQLFPGLPAMQVFNREWSVSATHPSFHEYFAVYGRAGSSFREGIPVGEVLGEIDNEPCALALPQGSGQAYLLPFRVANFANSCGDVLEAAVNAVDTYMGGSSQEVLPDFLAEVRLPGEEETLDHIEEKEAELVSLQARAADLKKFRHLIGTASGDSLEGLAVEALNLILDETGVQAVDREDVGAEDFWLVGPSGDFALAEAKGVGGHVRRTNVNQVDDHRDAHNLEQDAMPGLLIVNVFRNTMGDDVEQRELPVSPGVTAHAAKNNVLILRTRDLFYLLHRKMAGEEAGQELIDALQAGGGWLKVDENAAELQTS